MSDVDKLVNFYQKTIEMMPIPRRRFSRATRSEVTINAFTPLADHRQTALHFLFLLLLPVLFRTPARSSPLPSRWLRRDGRTVRRTVDCVMAVAARRFRRRNVDDENVGRWWRQRPAAANDVGRRHQRRWRHSRRCLRRASLPHPRHQQRASPAAVGARRCHCGMRSAQCAWRLDYRRKLNGWASPASSFARSVPHPTLPLCLEDAGLRPHRRRRLVSIDWLLGCDVTESADDATRGLTASSRLMASFTCWNSLFVRS